MLCSEEEGTDDVLLSFFSDFLLHAPDGCLKEKINQVFVGPLGADAAQCVYVLALTLLRDDHNGVVLKVKNVVGKEPAQTAVPIAERVQVFVETMEACGQYKGMNLVGFESLLSSLEQLRYP